MRLRAHAHTGVGVAVLLRNWTLPTGQNGAYDTAAKNQLNYLLQVAPRAPNGAISHRASEAQLWADFIYMAPPFIAYYGALRYTGTCCSTRMSSSGGTLRSVAGRTLRIGARATGGRPLVRFACWRLSKGRTRPTRCSRRKTISCSGSRRRSMACGSTRWDVLLPRPFSKY